MSSPLIGYFVSTRAATAPAVTRENDLSFRPGQPAYRGQSWAPARERSGHVRGLCPWCCRAGGKSLPLTGPMRRGPPCPAAGAPRAGRCPAGSAGCLPPPRVRGGRIKVIVAWRPARRPGRLCRRHQPPPGTLARCLAAGPGAVPHPPLAHSPCPGRCPRPGPGGMRYTARHPTTARLPPPGPPGAGMIPGAAVICALTAMARIWRGCPRHSPGAAGMARRDWRWRAAIASSGQLLVPTGVHGAFESFRIRPPI